MDVDEPHGPLERLAELSAAAVPRGDIDAGPYLERRLGEGTLDDGLLAAAAADHHDADLGAVVAGWAEAEPGTPEAGYFGAVRALGWEILLADPDRGGDIDRRGWTAIGHHGRPKGRS